MVDAGLTSHGKAVENSTDEQIIASWLLRNVSDTPRLAYAQHVWLDRLVQDAMKLKQVRTLRFVGSDQSAAESERALLGLVDAHLDTWPTIADIYGWGTLTQTDSM